MSKTYWQEVKPITGSTDKPQGGGIAIIGGGFAGVSAAYFLQENGFDDITLIDLGEENGSYYRNAGHLLVGNGESYHRNINVHGVEKARRIQHFAETFCRQIEETIERHKIECDYIKGNHFYLAASEAEKAELSETNKMIESKIVDPKELGFKLMHSGLQCFNSASAHPVKFRNGLLKVVLDRGAKYHSTPVTSIIDDGNDAVVDGVRFDAVVICTNAYSIQHSDFFAKRELIDPFKGQIIVSEPLDLPPEQVRVSFNSDHGFMYGQFTADNRLLIGGWRNNISGAETGSFDLEINEEVEAGLKKWTKDNLGIEPRWDYSWSGIMGSSATGLPFVGGTNENRIYCCAGFTGYGFAWAHGSAKVLADVMVGNDLIDGWDLFDGRR